MGTAITGLSPAGTAAALAGQTIPGPLAIAAASNAPLLSLVNTQAAPASPALQITAAAAADKAVGIQVAGDTAERNQIDSTGRHDWGTGALAVDSGIFRSGAAKLGTNSVVHIRTAGTSFTILSSNAADTSSVAWEIIEPG